MNPICRGITRTDPASLYQAMRYCFARYSFCLAEMRATINKLLRNEGMGSLDEAETPDELLASLEERVRRKLERSGMDISEAAMEEGVKNFVVSILATALTVFADKVGISCPEAGEK